MLKREDLTQEQQQLLDEIMAKSSQNWQAQVDAIIATITASN